MKNLINPQNINLRKGTLLFLLLTCLAYTALAQEVDNKLDGNDVTIVDGIITGCKDAFSKTSIIIPEKIGDITITGIGSNAFVGKSLVAVAFAGGSQVTYIEKGVFWGNNIATLTLPTALTTIGEEAFTLNQITELSLPENLTTIGTRAFSRNKITKLTPPASLKTIGSEAFFNNDITELTIPEGSQLETIGSYAFKDNSITTLSLPPSLETIGESAFLNNSLTTVTVTFNDDPNKSQIQSIGSKAFSENEELTITLPKHAKGADVTYKDSNDQEYNQGDSFTHFDRSLVTVIPTFYTLQKGDVDVNDEGIITKCNCEKFDSKRIIIPVQIGETTITGITNQNPGVFEDKNLVSVKFADGSGVMTIGSNAFRENQIIELTFPADSQLESIGEYAFYDNDIVTLTLPTKLKTIENSAFYYNKISELTFPENSQLTTIVSHAFRGNKISELTLPISLTTIGSSAFENNPITELTLPISLTTIGDRAFILNQITELTFPDDSQLASIGRSAFENNPITELTLPTTLTNIGYKAFFLNKIATLTFPEDSQLTTIGENAFDNNPSLESFTLPMATKEGFRTYWKDGNSVDLETNLTIPKADFGKSFELVSIEQVTLTVKVNDKEGGSIEPSDDHFAIDKADPPSTQKLTAKPNDGWRFDKWEISDEENKTDKTTTITLDQDKTATAHFVQLVTLTTAVAEQQGGTISAIPKPSLEDNQYDIKTKVTLTATPDDSWRFDKWEISDEENKTDKTTTITLDQDKTATAHFVKQVILTLIIEETLGKVSGLSAGKNKIDKGVDFKLEAMPASGQKFVSWTIDGKTIEYNPHTLTTTEADIGITVTFEAIPQQVTLTLDIEGEGSINPLVKPNSVDPDNEMKGMYDINTEIELTATPNEGWRFDKWVISDEENKTDKTTTITLDKNKSVTAHFVEGEEAITSILTEVVSANPYPNPVTSQITLKAKDGDLIQLFSPKGKQQYSTQHTGNEAHTIDVSTLSVGVYLVRITDAEGNTTTKRIVKK